MSPSPHLPDPSSTRRPRPHPLHPRGTQLTRPTQTLASMPATPSPKNKRRRPQESWRGPTSRTRAGTRPQPRRQRVADGRGRRRTGAPTPRSAPGDKSRKATPWSGRGRGQEFKERDHGGRQGSTRSVSAKPWRTRASTPPPAPSRLPAADASRPRHPGPQPQPRPRQRRRLPPSPPRRLEQVGLMSTNLEFIVQTTVTITLTILVKILTTISIRVGVTSMPVNPPQAGPLTPGPHPLAQMNKRTI